MFTPQIQFIDVIVSTRRGKMSNRMNFWTTSGDWIDISPYCTDFSTTDQFVSVHIFTRNKSHVDGEVYLIPSLQITRQSY